jgi:hypothetical protein
MALGSDKAHLHGKSLAGDSSIALRAFRVRCLAENARVRAARIRKLASGGLMPLSYAALLSGLYLCGQPRHL